MHCEKGGLLTANWVRNHRLAALSNSTIGSPSLKFSQLPPKPVNSTLPSIGPSTILPLLLSNTARPVLTHCTYWVVPTDPTVSGGSPVIVKLPRPIPGKVATGPMASFFVAAFCSAVSARAASLVGNGGSFLTRCSTTKAPCALSGGLIELNGGETS